MWFDNYSNWDKGQILCYIILSGSGMIANCLVALAVILRTPPELRSYSLFLLISAIVEGLSCLFCALTMTRRTMHRLVFFGDTLLYVYLGFCAMLDSTTCHVVYTFALSTFEYSVFLLIIQFIYRLLVLNRPPWNRGRLLSLCMALFIPCFILWLSLNYRANTNREMRIILERLNVTQTYENYMISGFVSVNIPSIIFAIIFMEIPTIPSLVLIYFIRARTLHKIRTCKSSLSKYVRDQHRLLVKILTVQSLLPLFYTFGCFLFLLERLGISITTQLEQLNIMANAIMPAASPLVILYYIRPYRNYTQMIWLLEIVLDFCDRVPVLSIFAITICILSSIPSLFLLFAVQRCAVHENCRLLVSLWSISLCTILMSVMIMYAHMLTFDNGFLPRGITSPPLRVYLLWLHGTIYFGSSSYEMFIVVERMLSTRQPHVYHESGRATKTIIGASIIAYALGVCSGYLLFISGPRALGLFLHNLVDLLTLVMNTLGIHYSKRRFNALYGKGSLNARYQVKEAYLMAKAMNPVYLVSFLLKGSATTVGYIYVLILCCEDDRYFVVIDFTYYLLHITNCVFSSTFLIFKHASIRKSARSLLMKKIEPERDNIINGFRTSETTNAYFEMLGNAWK